MKAHLLLLFVVFTQNAFSQSPASDCVLDHGDPFEPHHRLLRGEDKGKCFDPRYYRPLVSISRPEQAYHLAQHSIIQNALQSEDMRVVANIFSKNKFWIAIIPLEKIRSVIFQTVYFKDGPKKFGHGQARVHFYHPITLISQTQSEPTQMMTLHDLILTTVASGAVREGAFNPTDGIRQRYLQVLTVSSLSEVIGYMFENNGKKRVEQISMNLSRSERRKYLETYINLSAHQGLSVVYHTHQNNCNTPHFRDVLPSIRKESFLTQLGKAIFIRGLNPATAREDLKALRFADKNQPPDLIDDPSAQSFIREFQN